jgi:radical SAM protein with 4Fe4S-binding SPASM domain
MHENLILSNFEYKRVVDFIYRVRTLHRKSVFLNGGDCMGLGAKNLVTQIDYSTGNCAAGKTVVGIRSNGDVVGCLSIMNNDYIEGNIRQRSLTDIWNDEHAFAYNRNPVKLTGRCAGCTQAQSCKGGCKSLNVACGHPTESPYCMQFMNESI